MHGNDEIPSYETETDSVEGRPSRSIFENHGNDTAEEEFEFPYTRQDGRRGKQRRTSGISASAVKRRHTLSVKLDALKQIEHGRSTRSMAKQLGVQPKSIRNWRKGFDTVDLSQYKSGRLTLHKGRRPQGADIQENLYRWILQQRRNLAPVHVNNIVCNIES